MLIIKTTIWNSLVVKIVLLCNDIQLILLCYHIYVDCCCGIYLPQVFQKLGVSLNFTDFNIQSAVFHNSVSTADQISKTDKKDL